MPEIPSFGTVRENEERRDGGCAIVYDPETKLFAVGARPNNHYHVLFSGGFDAGEDAETGVLRELREESGLCNYALVEKVGEAYAHYFNRVKRVNRVAHTTCYLVVLKDTDTVPTALEEHENFTLHFVTREELLSNWNAGNEDGDLDHWIYYLEKASIRVSELEAEGIIGKVAK